jgi:hypothetical protein
MQLSKQHETVAQSTSVVHVPLSCAGLVYFKSVSAYTYFVLYLRKKQLSKVAGLVIDILLVFV